MVVNVETGVGPGGIMTWAKSPLVMAITCGMLAACGGGGSDGGSVEPPAVNKAPVFTSDAYVGLVDAELETGYRAVATDEEGDGITYSLSGGADEVKFLLDPHSGALSFVSIPDFDAPHDENADNIYEVEVSATDDLGAATTLLLNIEIVDNRVLLRIPVVVHVLYRDSPDHESNISKEKILSQIEVLNKDYRRRNTDLDQVNSDFRAVVADTEIEFELAKVDMQGNATEGITRTLDLTGDFPGENNRHFTNRGGQDAWPADHYLNIWVYDGSDRLGNVGLGGRGQYPGGDPLTDGVTMPYQFFGTIAPFANKPGLRLGRTATHEIGHWLDLRHSDMPTNFMDTYVDDAQMLMFSEEQKQIIHATFAAGGGREALYEHLTGQ